MIFVCPNCGSSLGIPIENGLSHCSNCNFVFHTSNFNKLSSWAWELRKGKSLDVINKDQNLSEENYKILQNYIEESGYSHDEFYCFLKKTKISESIA